MSPLAASVHNILSTNTNDADLVSEATVYDIKYIYIYIYYHKLHKLSSWTCISSKSFCSQYSLLSITDSRQATMPYKLLLLSLKIHSR